MIVKRGDKWCLISKTTGRNLGCFDTKEQAMKRERQVQFFKTKESGEPEDVWLTLEEVEQLCPACAEHMRESNLSKINLTKISEQGNLSALINFWRKQSDPGLFRQCVSTLKGKPGITNVEALCAWLHNQATGKFSGAHESIELHESETFQLLEAGPEGKEWEVILIQAGKSKNGRVYKPEVLKKATKLFEGAKAYAYEFKGQLFDHLPDTVRSKVDNSALVKNLVGVYENVRWDENRKAIVGKFRVLASWMKDLLKNAWENGVKDILGFSIDAIGKIDEATGEVVELAKIDEVTIVSNPAAGGKLLRMVASKQKNKELDEMEKLLAYLKEKYPEVAAQVKESATIEEMVDALMRARADEGKVGTDGISADDVKQMVEAVLAERESEAAKKRASRELLESKLAESKLPEPVKEDILADYGDRVLTEAEINVILERKQKILAQMAESGVNVPGQEREDGQVNIKQDELDKFQKAMDLMLDAEPHDKDGNRAFGSLHESFRVITGVSGIPAEIGRKIFTAMAYALEPLDVNREIWMRQVESHVNKITESVTTSTWTQVFGDSVRRKLQKEYNHPDYQAWRNIVSQVGNAQDFRTNRRIIVGGYGNLPTISEGQTYQPLSSPTDVEVTFAVAKRGGLEDYTLEAAINDDLGVLRRIPQKLGRSAARTLYEFVFDFLANGFSSVTWDPDSTAIFDATHNNTSTSALSETSLTTAIQAIRSQTEPDSGKPLGLLPKYLVVPIELEKTAMELAGSSVTQQSARNETVDAVYMRKFNLQVIVVPYWTDSNNWFVVADKAGVETIEVDFLQGKQEPELFIQDQPTVGSVFTADKITFKIRHIYGGDVLDYRGLYGANVA